MPRPAMTEAPTGERAAPGLDPAAAVAAAADPRLPRPFRVRATHRETRDVVSLDLAADDGGPAIAFRPGQFTMVYAFGLGEIPLSISGDPGRAEVLRHTVRDVGPVSRAIAAAQPGDVLGVRGPYGRGWPMEDLPPGHDLLLVAGGLGLAPLRPVIMDVAADRAAPRRLVVLVGARTPADVPFAGELADLAAAGTLHLRLTVDVAAPEWAGPVGPVTTLLPRCGLEPARTTAMVCGPEIMMRLTARDLVDAGVAPERVHLSMERTMACAVGFCGRCQYGPDFVCRDGPVRPFSVLQARLRMPEL